MLEIPQMTSSHFILISFSSYLGKSSTVEPFIQCKIHTDQYFNMESEEMVADQLVSQAISEAQRVLAEDCDSDISEEPKDSECTGFLNTDINEPTNR